MPEVAREIALIAVSGDLRTNYYYYFFYYYDDDDDENNATQSDDCIAIRVSTALVRALLSYLSIAISVRVRLFHDTAYNSMLGYYAFGSICTAGYPCCTLELYDRES